MLQKGKHFLLHMHMLQYDRQGIGPPPSHCALLSLPLPSSKNSYMCSTSSLPERLCTCTLAPHWKGRRAITKEVTDGLLCFIFETINLLDPPLCTVPDRSHLQLILPLNSATLPVNGSSNRFFHIDTTLQHHILIARNKLNSVMRKNVSSTVSSQLHSYEEWEDIQTPTAWVYHEPLFYLLLFLF